MDNSSYYGSDYCLSRCPICGSSGKFRLSFLVKGKPILWCDQCTGHFRPLTQLAPESTQEFQTEAFSDRYVSARESIRFWLLLEANRIVSIRQRFCPVGGRLLEIGCSTGELLLKFRQRGYHVNGIELAEAAATFAREKYTLDVSTKNIYDLEVTSKYDTVVAIHALEHLPDQMKAVTQIHKILVPGGLVLIEVPSIESWNVRLKGHRADCFTDQHLVFHTQKSLKHLFEHAGFEVVKVWTAESLTGLFNTLIGALGIMHLSSAITQRLRKRITAPSRVVPISSATDSGVINDDLSLRHRTSYEHIFLSVGRFSLTGLAVLFGVAISPLRWVLSRSGLGGSIFIVARKASS